MKNAINWFEVPVKDFKRAKTFYETVLHIKMEEMKMEGSEVKYAFFECDMENGVGGGIVENKAYTPSDKGVLVYLNAGDDLSLPLSRIEKAGGKILVPKTSIGPHGFMAQFLDTEGNKLALHSMH